jgi:hypothetical protein
MEKEFVPYELAVKLKELGFDLEPIDSFGVWCVDFPNEKAYLKKCGIIETIDDVIAPTYQQFFDGVREKYNYHYEIFLSNEPPYSKFHYRIMQIGKYFTLSYDDFEGTYEEARQACLEKLIELCFTQKI